MQDYTNANAGRIMKSFFLVCFSLAGLPASAAASCYDEGAAVALTGVVQMKVIPPGPDSPPKGWRYPLLTLPAAVCLTNDGGHDISTKSIAIVAKDWHQLTYKAGAHVTVKGELGSPQNGNAPPEDLLLTVEH